MIFLVLAGLFLAAGAGGFAYRWAWVRFHRSALTPKGYGALLPLFLIAGGVLLGETRDLLLIFAITAAGTAIYWWDDVEAVSFRVRFLVQFVAGCLIGAILLRDTVPSVLPLFGCCIAAGIVNVVLTNAINFFDGADLNSAAMNILVALLVLAIGPLLFASSMAVVLAFVIPFAIWNSVPARLYFGDSGCFAVSCLATAMAVFIAKDGREMNLLPLVPVAWAVFDAFCVFVIRVSNKEDLLSRNYHHLYQKMQAKYPGFVYLLPQPLNVAAVFAGGHVFASLGLNASLAMTASAVVVTPALYLACRRFLLRGSEG